MPLQFNPEPFAQDHGDTQQQDRLPAVERGPTWPAGVDIRWNEVTAMRPLSKLIGGQAGQALHAAGRNHALIS